MSSSASSGAQLEIEGAAAQQLIPTTIGNTTYYPTVDAWKIAGSPKDSDSNKVVIGLPPQMPQGGNIPKTPVSVGKNYQGKEITSTLQANTIEELDVLISNMVSFAQKSGMEAPRVILKERDHDGGYKAIVVAHNDNELWVPGGVFIQDPGTVQQTVVSTQIPANTTTQYTQPTGTVSESMGLSNQANQTVSVPLSTTVSPTIKTATVTPAPVVAGSTTYYPTVQAWRDAGSPAGNETTKVLIGTPSPTTTTATTITQPTVATPTVWKPDFSLPNPYAGMPSDYASRVADGFVPTSTNPLNPVQVAVLNDQVSGTDSTITNLSPTQQQLLGVTNLNQLTTSQIDSLKTGYIPPSTPTGINVSGVPQVSLQTTGITTQFKPDFTKENPYEGAPLSYYQLEMRGFIPTASNPLPPSLSYLQSNPNAKLVRDTHQREPQQLTQSEYERYQSSTPEEQFKILMEKGYIPKGSVYQGKDANGQVLYFTPEAVLRNQMVGLWNQRVGQLITQQKEYTTAIRDKVSQVAKDNNIQISNQQNMNQDEMVALIKAGVDPQALVVQGQDFEKVKAAVDSINATYNNYISAANNLKNAGIDLTGNVTIAELARYQRQTGDSQSISTVFTSKEVQDKVNEYNKNYEDGRSEIESYFTSGSKWTLDAQGQTIANAFAEHNLTNTPIEGTSFNKAGLLVDNKTGETVTAKEAFQRIWGSLSVEQKESVIDTIAKDPNKGNYFATLNRAVNIDIEKGGIIPQLVTSGLTPITNIIAKQMTIQEAKVILDKTYATELKAVSSYINKNGTVDINNLKEQLASNPSFSKQVLEETGYTNTSDLVKNLDNYNSGIRVTGGEWATAGAVGAIDVLSLGGGSLLSGLGAAGRYATSGILIGAEGVFLPSQIATLKSPTTTGFEKGMAIATPIMLLTGAGLEFKTGVKGVAGESSSRISTSAEKAFKPDIPTTVKLGEAISDIKSGIKDIPTKINSGLDKSRILIDTVTKEILSGERTLKAIDNMGHSLGEVKINVTEFVKQLPSNAGKTITNSFNSVRTAIETINTKGYDSIYKTINALDKLETNIQRFGAKADFNTKMALVESLNKFKSSVTAIINELRTGDKTFATIDKINSIRSDIAENIKDYGTKIKSNAERAIDVSMDKAVNALKEVTTELLEGNKIAKRVEESYQAVDRLYQDALFHSKEFIRNTSKETASAFNKSLDKIVDTLENFTKEGISGESFNKLVDKINQDIRGLKALAEWEWVKTKGKAWEMSMASKDALNKGLANIRAGIESLAENITQGADIGDTLSSISDSVKEIKTAMQNKDINKAISKSIELNRAAADYNMKWIKREVTNTINEITDAIKNRDSVTIKSKSEYLDSLASELGDTYYTKDARINIRNYRESLKDYVDTLEKYPEGQTVSGEITTEGYPLEDIKTYVESKRQALEKLGIKNVPELKTETIKEFLKSLEKPIKINEPVVNENPINSKPSELLSEFHDKYGIGKIKGEGKIGDVEISLTNLDEAFPSFREAIREGTNRFPAENPEYTVSLDSILAKVPQTGAGTKAMEILIKMADKYDTPLFIRASEFINAPKGTMNTAQLVNWYKKFGFVFKEDGAGLRMPNNRSIPSSIKGYKTTIGVDVESYLESLRQHAKGLEIRDKISAENTIKEIEEFLDNRKYADQLKSEILGKDSTRIKEINEELNKLANTIKDSVAGLKDKQPEMYKVVGDNILDVYNAIRSKNNSEILIKSKQLEDLADGLIDKNVADTIRRYAKDIQNNTSKFTENVKEIPLESGAKTIEVNDKTVVKTLNDLFGETRELTSKDITKAIPETSAERILGKGSREYKAGEIQPSESAIPESKFNPEEFKLMQEISRDTKTLTELKNQGGDPLDIQRVTDRINKNISELSKLREIKVDAEPFNKLIDERLRELGYSNDDILRMSDKEKLNKVANDIPPESKSTGKQIEPEKPDGGGVGVKEKVETKTEVKPETKPMTKEELDRLMKEKKTEEKPETKTEQKPSVKEETRTRTGAEEQVFITPSPSGAGDFYTLVWEDGRLHWAWVHVSPLEQGYVRIETAGQEALIPQEEYNRMTPEQVQRLYTDIKEAERIAPYVSPYPTPQPSPQPTPQPQPQPSPQPQPTPEPEPQPTPTPTPEPQPEPAPEPTPQPVPQPEPQPERPYPVPIQTRETVIRPPVITTKMPDDWSKTGVPKGTIEWRQGRKWVVLPPPYNDESKMYLDHPIPGTYKFATGRGSAYKTLQCFPSGTKVLVANPKPKSREGLRMLKLYPFRSCHNEKIENISVGDLILSYNEITAEKQFKKVTNTFRRDTTELCLIRFSNGNQIVCTPEHPIAVVYEGGIRWVPAKKLKSDNRIIQYIYSGLNARIECLDKDKQKKRSEIIKNQRSGKTLEEIFGESIATRIRDSVGNAHRGVPICPLGKTLEEFYGDEKALAIKSKESISAIKRGIQYSPVWCKGLTKETDSRLAKIAKDKSINGKGKKNPFWGKHHSEETKRILMVKTKSRWEVEGEGFLNKEVAKRRIERTGLKPNRGETRLSYLIRKVVSGEYKYNGDGRLGIAINGMIPDFWNVNGKKKVIEYFGSYWHKPGDEKQKIAKYNKLGIDCLVIWDYEMQDIDAIKNRILTFTHNPKVELASVVSVERYKTKPQNVHNLEVEDNNNYFAEGILVHNCIGTPPSDADVDMGWAKIHISSKGKELEMTFAGGQDAANDRWTMEQQYMNELERQSYANLPQETYQERIPRYRQPMTLNKQEIPEYSTDGVKVYSINPAYIRNKYANKMIGDRKGVDWVSGGHEFVYWNIIPKNEIWVDNTLEGEDRDAVILHEIEEREQMSKGMDYSEAHNDFANKVEIAGRQNPQEIESMIASAIKKYHEEYNVEEPPKKVTPRVYNNGNNLRVRQTQTNNGVFIPSRYYLGRKLRPTSLA